jgi:magnesium chelatase family protein
MHVEVVPVPFKQLSDPVEQEGSRIMLDRVVAARTIQEKRFTGITGVSANAQMGPALRKRFCLLDRAGDEMVRLASERLGLSARAYDRILKLARTIADLDESERILPSHVAEAVTYRNLDREGWSG